MTYIAPKTKVLKHLDRVLAWQRGDKPAPVTVEWDLSNRCSLGCQDCHFAHTHSRGPWVAKSRHLPMAFESTGDLADVDVVCRALGELAEAGVKAVIWSGGGEPTLHPEWPFIMAHAQQCGLEQGMYTLGGHLDEQKALILGRLAQFVVVSLDAADADTYAADKCVHRDRWERACEGVRAVSRVGGAAVGASFLLGQGNWLRAYSMLRVARELGATYATFRPAIQFHADVPAVPSRDTAWITAALPTLRALANESDVEIDVDRFIQYRDWTGHGYNTCYGIRLNTTITPDGRVWICPNRRGMPGSCLGDLREESFGAIWARHPAQFTVNDQCRVMCRLHPINTVLHAIEQPQLHEAFV